MNDLINGSFELLGGLFIINHCRILYKQKFVGGVSIVSNLFFTSWGIWNLFYYPSLDQLISFYGGIFLVLTNLIWIAMLYHYTKNPGGNRYESVFKIYN